VEERFMDTSLILVPVDFSPHAERALDYAIMLARKLPARLLLLHVIHALPLGVTEMGSALPEAYLQDIESEVHQSLGKYLQRLREAGLEGETAIVHGVPFEKIAQIAKARKVHLIVIGTHGRTGLEHLFLGSVAEKVVRLAACPVLVTR
jgi:nucleotide-binding universal stress UspA family protein